MSSRPLLEARGTPAQPVVALCDRSRPSWPSAERIFQDELGSRFPFVQQLVDHCADFRGKRLRPALVLLSGQACGALRRGSRGAGGGRRDDSHGHPGPRRHPRRGRDPPACRHGQRRMGQRDGRPAGRLSCSLMPFTWRPRSNRPAPAAGSATRPTRSARGRCSRCTTAAISTSTKTDYFAIIEGKTAELTAVSCRLGASYAGAAEPTVAALDRYGRNLGVAFQIADDVLDIWGDERVTGKSLGTDLEKQKLTLPVIRCSEPGRPRRPQSIRSLLSRRRAEERRRLRALSGREPGPRLRLAARQAIRQAGHRRPRLPGGFRGQVGAAHPWLNT